MKVDLFVKKSNELCKSKKKRFVRLTNIAELFRASGYV